MHHRTTARAALAFLFTLSAGCERGEPPTPPTDAGVDVADGDLADTGASAGDASAPDPALFTALGHGEVDCPWSAGQCEAGWPAGRVLAYESEERFEDELHPRSFYVVVPDGVAEPAPLWIHLHGGYGSAERTIRRHEVDEVASGEAIAWQRNEGACRFDPYAEPAGFRRADGEACEPLEVRAVSAERAILVLPEGVDRDGQRHWEDGRVPSPGFGSELERRDDVGFLDHVIATLLADPELPIDRERIYLSGISNGGNLVLRAICTVGDPRYPELARIAAFSVVVSALAEGSARGLSGRAACRASAPHPLPVHYIVGRGFDTPDPETDGDGRVPWGVPGEVRANNSPSGGMMLSVDDTFDLLRRHLEASAGGAATETVEPLGAFTTRREAAVAGSEARVVRLATDGGAHSRLGSRMDFLPAGREWDFLARHRLVEGRVVVGPSPMTGQW